MKSFFILILFLVQLGVMATERPVLVIVGTRPEAIKMLPLYQTFKKNDIPVHLCSTGQHKELLEEIFIQFDVKPDSELHVMHPGQDLNDMTCSILSKTKMLFQTIHPRLVLVQGDTVSAMASALSAFYLKIPVGHVEAGLRTGNIYAPFPEELNRRLISQMSTYHFAPTVTAAQNLIQEGIAKDNVFCTGNTVIDALRYMEIKLNDGSIVPTSELAFLVENHKNNGFKIVLLTAHRRESLGEGLKQIFRAIKQALIDDPRLFIVYPMHPNPIIKQLFDESDLGQFANLMVVKPLVYSDLVYVLRASDVVMTDSGGITEEAVCLNKPTLILRNETDRPEGIGSGLAQLVGTNEQAIINALHDALSSSRSKNDLPMFNPIYGDGTACQQITAIIQNKFFEQRQERMLK